MWSRFTVLFHVISLIHAYSRAVGAEFFFYFYPIVTPIDIDTNTHDGASASHYNAHWLHLKRCYSGIEVTESWEYSYCVRYILMNNRYDCGGAKGEKSVKWSRLCHYEDRHAYVALRENTSSCLPDRSSLTWERLLHRKQSFNCNLFFPTLRSVGCIAKRDDETFELCNNSSDDEFQIFFNLSL